MRVSVYSQDPNKLTREVVSAIGQRLGTCEFVSGAFDDDSSTRNPNVRHVVAPSYNRRSTIGRAISWLKYLVFAGAMAAAHYRRTDVFLFVSSPPLNIIIGGVLSIFGRVPYVLLVNDLYPDIAEALGRLRPDGVVARVWRRANAFGFARASQVITISAEMADEIGAQLSRTDHKNHVVVIPTWVDTTVIKPVDKRVNPVAVELGVVDKLTVLYAGNFGHVAAVEILPSIAAKFGSTPGVQFLVAGRGQKAAQLEQRIAKAGLSNCTLLPYQAEEKLPGLLASADIGIVLLDPLAKGMAVPSKTCYYMAAGLALVVLCAPDDTLERLVRQFECGVVAHNHNEVHAAIAALVADSALVTRYKANARAAAEAVFDKERNLARIVSVLSDAQSSAAAMRR